MNRTRTDPPFENSNRTAPASRDAIGEEAIEGDAIHVLASGRVQGVGFRHFVRTTADALGCAGWVRNLPDGRVEAVVAGPAAAVQAMLDAVARGPGGARVDAVATRLALEEERAQVRRPFAVWRDA